MNIATFVVQGGIFTMQKIDIHNTSYLDTMRQNKGANKLKQMFRQLILHDKNKASYLINDNHLRFGTFYILWPLLDHYRPLLKLSTRNVTALKIMEAIVEKNSAGLRQLQKKDKQLTQSTLAWMLGTGFIDDGLNKQYDEIIDSAGIILVKDYQNIELISPMIEIVFQRNKKGTYYYDLLWCLFETRNPQVLLLIARYLDSSNPEDRALAQKLLWFVPEDNYNRAQNTVKDFSSVINWLRNNAPFLEYTGESFQQKGNPAPFLVSLTNKYLCKPVSAERSDTPYEQQLLKNFNCLDTGTQEILANYSFMLYTQNRNWWNHWITLPVPEQARLAKAALGGMIG